MSKLSESTKIADEIKDLLDFDNYSAYTDFDVEEDKDYEGEWVVSFKLMDIPLELRIRFKEGEVTEDNMGEYGAPTMEFNSYEDNWEEFRTFDWMQRRVLQHLMFELAGRMNKIRKQ